MLLTLRPVYLLSLSSANCLLLPNPYPPPAPLRCLFLTLNRGNSNSNNGGHEASGAGQAGSPISPSDAASGMGGYDDESPTTAVDGYWKATGQAGAASNGQKGKKSSRVNSKPRLEKEFLLRKYCNRSKRPELFSRDGHYTILFP